MPDFKPEIETAMVNVDLIKDKLSAITNRLLTGAEIGADFCHDEYPGGSFSPDAVVEAASTQEVSAVLKACNEAGVPVTVRGAGTGQAGGSVPIKGGVVLSLKAMNSIVAFDESARTVTVQPGVLLQDVKAEAEKHGLYYPPDPGEKTATIGGNAATNASGPCAVKYGTTKDYIMDAVIVLADGTVTTLCGHEVVLGSEGTLAVITELKLKLVDKPKADAILLLPFMDSESCINAAASLIEKGFDPAVAEYMDTDIVEFSGKVTGNPVFPVEMDEERVAATLMLTLEGEDDDAVMEKMEAVAELAEELGCIDILVGDTVTMKRDFWTAHDAFHTSMESGAKCAFEYNVTVPTAHISDMLSFVKALGEEKGLKIMAYAHVGSGGLHIHAVSDCAKDEFMAITAELSPAVFAKCSELGGDVGGEYGIGYAKKDWLSVDAKTRFTAAKAALDSKGILNPGKVAD